MDVIFLGMNEAGEEAVDWLRKNEEVEVTGVYETGEAFEAIKKGRPELVVSSGFEHIVPKEIIEIPEKGIVNLHPSYLPHNRGAHPYIWPLIDGSPAGVSVHYMNENLDEGPLIARKKVEKRPDDDAKTLRDRLMEAQVELFKESWEKILEGRSRPQNLEEGSVHRKEDLDEVSDLDLEKEMNLEDAINLLRGLSYGDRDLGYFEKDGKKYVAGLDVRKE